MEALIFDMDGLMIDSERLYFDTEREMARRFKKTVEEETLWKMMGRSPLESMAVFVETLKLPLSPKEVLGKRNELMRVKLKNDLQSMPGLNHILDTFYGKLKMAVCTGAQKEFLDIVVDGLGIRKKFHALQTSDGIKHGKPDPEIYLETCTRLDKKPHQCVVLEDSSNGALAGKRAGCYVIAVPSEYTREQDFSFVHYIAADLFQAENHISRFLLSPKNGIGSR
ncbi:MAG: HAD family phosphatase [Candidatus Aminicenantes bacterium]|nr:HAD family phosphatase [Candidatus Aminicenantes bacterium]